MSEQPDEMPVEVKDSPVFDALQAETAEGSALINATALWRASGRKRNKSPRQWIPKNQIVHDPGGPADAAVLVDRNTAFWYAQVLCSKLMMAANEVFWRKLRADPARHMVGCPNSIMAMFAVPAVMQNEGVGQAEAAAMLVTEAVGRTEGLDSYEQETVVAKVQRAVRFEPDPTEGNAR